MRKERKCIGISILPARAVSQRYVKFLQRPPHETTTRIPDFHEPSKASLGGHDCEFSPQNELPKLCTSVHDGEMFLLSGAVIHLAFVKVPASICDDFLLSCDFLNEHGANAVIASTRVYLYRLSRLK